MHIQPHCFAPRHLIPALFVLALLGCLLLLPLFHWPLALLLCAYGTVDLAFSVKGALREEKGRLLTLLALPLLFPLVHIVYGAGTLLGLLTPRAKEEGPHA